MGKSKLSYQKDTILKVNIKGSLTEDCKQIIYLDEDENQQTVCVEELLKPFSSKDINLFINLKESEPLYIGE